MSKLTIQQKKNNSKTSLYYYYCNNHLSIESSTTRAILCTHTHIFIISVYSLL
jgi:hypothetical protein